jgi:capsular exopolysaccharide synthesis family protein
VTVTSTQDTVQFLQHLRVVRSRKEVLIAVFLLTVAAGVLTTYRLPKVYTASTVIAVKEDAPDVDVFTRQAVGRYDPYFLRTQFEIIQSTPVIEEVVRKLNLNDRMAAAYGYAGMPADKAFDRTVRLLSKSIRVQQYRDTNLIEIRVFLSEPRDNAWQVAADVADAVANVYRSLRMRDALDVSERGIRALMQALEEQKRKVQACDEQVEKIRQQYKIALLGSSAGTDTALSKMTLAQLDASRIRARAEMEEKKALLDRIAAMTTNELRDAAAYIVGDSSLAALIADKRRAEVQLREKLNAQLGPRHPEVIQTQAVIDGLESKVLEALGGLRKGVQAGYETSKAKFDAMEAEVERVKASEISAEGAGYKEFEKARQELDQARQIYQSLEARSVQERIELQIPRTPVEVVAPAKAADPEMPSSPNWYLNVLLSVLAGLVAGIGLAFFVEYLDTSLKSVDEVEQFLGLPVLGVVPQKMRALNDERADLTYAEAYRVLRANLRFSQKWSGKKTLTVTSGGVGEGKSLTLFNLACVSAQLGEKVLIVDADLHRPRQHRLARIENADGLVSILLGERTAAETVVCTGVDGLDMIPSGRVVTGAVHGLLDSERFRRVVESVRDRYDLILVDAPPVMGVSDTSVLIREAEGVMIVVQHRQYPRAVARRARDVAETLGGNLIGIALNNVDLSRDHAQYRYHYYEYYSRRKAKGAQA